MIYIIPQICITHPFLLAASRPHSIRESTTPWEATAYTVYLKLYMRVDFLNFLL